MHPRAKKAMMGTLVACFMCQTYLVYSDGDTDVQLEGEALRGAEVWHEEGCQTCHQLYGFGGFLGPDLTNSASNLGAGFDERLAFVLESGPGQMPAFELEEGDAAALGAFLRAMDETGVGVARAARPERGGSEFERAVAASFDRDTPEGVRRGFEAFRARPCQACHRPFTDVPSGPPDLSKATERVARDELLEVLREGRSPSMPVPQPPLSGDESQDLLMFLDWLGDHRSTLTSWKPEEDAPTIELSELPWWEYEGAP
jgi:nitric oxide reductase subunit C